MEYHIEIDSMSLEPTTLWEIARSAMNPHSRLRIDLTRKARHVIDEARTTLEFLIGRNSMMYGINTGVGSLYNEHLSSSDVEEFQRNLLRSHSCGVGHPLSRDLVMGMWLVTLNSIAKGHRGIRPVTCSHIISILEAGILGVVPSRGSVGASGDLAPCAHAALVLIGEGWCTMPQTDCFVKLPSRTALETVGLVPFELAAKEGLSLMNGTQLSTVLALKVWNEASRLVSIANLAAAMSMVGMQSSLGIIYEPLLEAHQHPGTLHAGRDISCWLGTSPQSLDPPSIGKRLQDPYSIRCCPQVHGAVWEEIESSENILCAEINASTDNPLLFPVEGTLCHGGNFHAIYPGRVSDRLASALTVLASISERRINIALNAASSGLPSFLTKNGGLNCGLMMVHPTAAALVAECRSLCFPATVDSIPTNCDQEDHVSMAPNAGFKALKIVENLRYILAIELLVATQAMDLVKGIAVPEKLVRVREKIRAVCPFVAQDRVLSDNIEDITELIRQEVFWSLR